MVALSHDSFKRSKRGIGKAGFDLSAEHDFVAKRLAAITNAKPLACPPATTTNKAKRKRLTRHSVFRLARVFISKMDSIRCVVVNLSADGARITMEDAYALPDIVTLRFDQSGVRRKARVAWRQDRDIGLCFIKDEV
ncbi:MAG: PilZ domain-containing protein [Pseudomonadota bacterium]